MRSQKHLVLVLSLLFLLPMLLTAKNKKSSKATFSLHIFSSNNITGNIEPCGWGGKRNGGFARRATYIKKNKKDDEHSLILDSGDFIGRRGERARLDAEYAVRTLTKLNYDAINIGERDFLQRVEFLTSKQQNENVPFISANIFLPDSETYVFPPYILKKLKGFKKNGKKVSTLKVGIFGIVFKRMQIVIDKNEPQLVVGDPIEAAKKVVDELKNRCDIIIALAHTRYPQIKTLAETVDGIDVIIGCHDPIYRPKTEIFGETIAIIGGSKGQYIGDLTIEFDMNKNIVNHTGRTVLLDQKIKDDPEILKIIQELKIKKTENLRKHASTQN